MEIKCSNCSHVQKFPFEVYEYSGYVCPECHSYYVGSDQDSWVFRKKFNPTTSTLWPELGEIIEVGESHPCIITKIQRNSQNGISNEYVGLNKEDNDVFFSDAEDYFCVLSQIHDSTKVKLENAQAFYNGRKYNFEEQVEQFVVYAEGFVFEDLDQKSTAETYAYSINDERFLSIETIDGEKEYYEGDYWERNQYLNLFNKFRDHREKSKKIGTQLLLIFIPILIIPAIVFYYINMPHRLIQNIEFNETFTSETNSNSFVSTSFELKGNANKKLRYEGFSIPDQSDVMLQIGLVNEKTNSVRTLRPIVHVANIKNSANALDIDFCRTEPGRYHLVYETSISSSSEKALKLEERIKLKYGGYSYMPLIVTYIVLAIGIIIFAAKTVSSENLDKYSSSEMPSAFRVLLKSGFFIFYLTIIPLLVGLQYFEERRSCESTINIDTQVDHTGTGSTRIYTRSPLFSGSHK